MSTPHINANKGDIAKTILLPGDPLRAEFIANNFLQDVKCFNKVRNMYGFTGTYQGKPVSVMGTGMGMPSMGIYSYELIHHFGVENLIRVGSCGSYREEVKVYDLVLAMGASTDSNYAHQYKLNGTLAAIASYELLEKAKDAAEALNYRYHVGAVKSADVFYEPEFKGYEAWANMGTLAAEMETFALYCNAAAAGAKALTILTVSDSLVTGEATSAEERQTSFTKMMDVALKLV